MVERISTSLMFDFVTRVIGKNQSDIYKVNKQITSGSKFSSPMDDPVNMIGSTHIQGNIDNNTQRIRDRDAAISNLDIQESALGTIEGLVQKIRESMVLAGSDTLNAQDRLVMKDQMRSWGESIMQIVNTNIDGRYVFSGQQSDLKTIKLTDGAAFNTAIFKNGQDDFTERKIDKLDSSVSIRNLLVGTFGPAILTNKIINPAVTTSGNVDFQVNDGNGNNFTFTANILAGDNLTTVASKINTAFNGAGGAGSIAQLNPAGFLELNTSLITGNAQNSTAKVTVVSTSNIATTNELGLNRQNSFGRDDGLLNVLSTLETALSANNSATIRSQLAALDFNLREIGSARARAGLLVTSNETFNDTARDLDIKFRGDLSLKRDVDMVDATMRLNNLQTALQTSVQTSNRFLSLSLNSFLG